MDNVVVSFSGGKDSYTSTILHLERGDKVTCLCYIPYFTDNIPLISREAYTFLHKSKFLLEGYGANFYFVKGVSYYDWCMRRLVKGKNVGKVQGFPLFIRGACGFMRDSKKKSIDSFVSSLSFDYIDIGYTIDEDRGVLGTGKRSLLRELSYTQFDTLKFVHTFRNGDILHPSYLSGNRDGCLLCPHAKRKDRFIFFEDYPEALPIVEYMQKVIYDERGFYPLRGKRFFVESSEMLGFYGSNASIFGDKIYN